MKRNDERMYTYYTGFLFGLLFICFAGAIIGDSTAEALLLSRCRVDLLPKMFFFNAVALFMASSFIMSIIDRVDRGRLFLIVTFSHAGVLLLVRAAIMAGTPWIFPPLFTYAYIAKILLFLLFWTLANDLIDSRRAQKTFPLIAAGGTLGAIVVAFCIPGIVRFFAAENLLFVWSACACVLGVLFIPLRKRAGKNFLSSSDHERHRTRSFRSTFDDMKVIGTDPLLSTMALLYGMLFFTLIAQHYFFYVQVKEHFITANRIAAFLGFFSGISMAVTVLLQFTVAGKMLKKFGSSRSMLFMPTVLCAVFITLTILGFAAPPPGGAALIFAAITAGMGLRIAFFDTFFSPNFQIFFSSLPREMRGRAKLTIEGVVKPVAIIVASIWLMICAVKASFAINMLVLSAAAAAVFLVTMRLRATYTESLTRFLASFSKFAGSGPLGATGDDAGLLTTVREILTKGDFEVRKYLIDELSIADRQGFLEIVRDRLRDPDPRIRTLIVSALGRGARKEDRDLVVSCLSDADERVVAGAILAAGNYSGPEIDRALEPFLTGGNGRCRANAAVALWRYGTLARKNDILRGLSALLDITREDECSAALRALGEIDAEETFECLRAFAEKSGCGKPGGPEKIRRQLVQAIGRKSGPAAIALLLEQAKGALRVRRLEIIAALASILGRGVPIDLVAAKIGGGDPDERNLLVRALDRAAVPVPDEIKTLLKTAAAEEIRGVERDRRALRDLDRFRALGGVELLTLAIREESIAVRLETLVHAVSLLDGSGKIRKILPRLFHADTHVRARAFEVLDNSGEVELNRKVMRALEEENPRGGPRNASRAVPVTGAAAETARGYMSNVNNWLSRCAGYAVFEMKAEAA